MLKALELTGFKSFADKTRFEFPAGITVVVGPNGSGKSNIVDAIKWVLGEQSAKSLRGKEMADVIFKGAGGVNGRKPANSATATILLDNADRRFAYDADEVHISRRVYLNGEAEYLINGEICRLKDIRNLFRGTGIGTDAYSLIEQGKVDQLLQASAKDRRAIFEEAAGISRFKAKKVEAQRRLARVDGNLVRLADIVEEVGSRYRSVKSQASKATRYKEYSRRLQELRTHVGLKDWRSFSEKLEKIAADNIQVAERAESLREQIAEKDGESKKVDEQLELISSAHVKEQEATTTVRETIAQLKSHIVLNQSRLEDILARRQQLETQASSSEARTQEFQQKIEIANTELKQTELAIQQSTQELQQLDDQLAQLDDQIEHLHFGNQAKREESTQRIGLITELGRSVSAAESQAETLATRKSQLLDDVDKLKKSLSARQQEFDRHVEEKTNLESEAASKDTALAAARKKCNEAKQSRIQLERNLSRIESDYAGKSQRAKVLQELEKRLEGVNAGAKQLLEQARIATSGPLKDIIGVVADLVSVNVQHAGIVDVALGNAAQYIVVDGHELLDLLASEELKVKGRVGFIQLDSPTTLGADPNVNVNGQPGVIGRADRLVQVNAQYASFIRQLLGGTWVVKSLADAMDMYRRRMGNVRFVTLDGEIVESDGTVVVGPKAIVTGLVSRRSELRLLHREIMELEELKKNTSLKLHQINAHEEECEKQVQILIGENANLASLLSDKTVRAAEAEKQIKETTTKLADSQRQSDESTGLLNSITDKLASEQSQLLATEKQLTSLQTLIRENDSQIEQLRGNRTELEKQITIVKVKLAKSEQRLETLHTRRNQDAQEFEQLQTELERQKAQLVSDRDAELNSNSEIKAGQEKLQQMESESARFAERLQTLTQQRTELETRRKELAQALRERRDELRQCEDRLHHAELQTDRLKMERNQIAVRLQEDYGINIAEVDARPTDETAIAERESIDSEITELRKKIGAIGAVNLDALAELEELEGRYLSMDQQYQDLVQAKQQLENIIQRINTDSRRLFIETVDAIRGNFQRLFRQTFGGGQADIVLEDGVDPLEAGIEIVATPPGKPQFNNSLLSGGEKALTAVSLLMAIFQFRPSPFCVLDEVDAPFDEANIGRFIEVLKSFLGWTKFVIVTHSKKTMTAATTLYGVTMQESGVSKRVSVRFEDVSEDGQISDEALSRSDDNDERGVA